MPIKISIFGNPSLRKRTSTICKFALNYFFSAAQCLKLLSRGHVKEWQCSVLNEKRKSWAPIESWSIGRKSASRLNVNVARPEVASECLKLTLKMIKFSKDHIKKVIMTLSTLIEDSRKTILGCINSCIFVILQSLAANYNQCDWLQVQGARTVSQ